MRTGWLVAASAAVLVLSAPTGAKAFECPRHFAAAQELIDKVATELEKSDMPKDRLAMVHTLLDDAKMLLAGAQHNHEKPQGLYDHARAIAKADSALGYARAADLLRARLM